MVSVLMSRIGLLSLVSPKSRSPAPSTTGKTFSRKLVDEVVFHQRVYQQAAGVDDDLTFDLPLEL